MMMVCSATKLIGGVERLPLKIKEYLFLMDISYVIVYNVVTTAKGDRMRRYSISLKTTSVATGERMQRIQIKDFDSPAEALAFGLEAAVDRNMKLSHVADMTPIIGWTAINPAPLGVK